jgi:hypothetical protein
MLIGFIQAFHKVYTYQNIMFYRINIYKFYLAIKNK